MAWIVIGGLVFALASLGCTEDRRTDGDEFGTDDENYNYNNYDDNNYANNNVPNNNNANNNVPDNNANNNVPDNNANNNNANNNNANNNNTNDNNNNTIDSDTQSPPWWRDTSTRDTDTGKPPVIDTTPDTPPDPDGMRECTASEKPSPVSGGRKGWASRYWDCCMPHCSWPNNSGGNTSKTCNKSNAKINTPQQSGCNSDDNNAGYTCWDQSPFAVCKDLAYGFAAVPADGQNVCGKCFQLDFDGGFQHGEAKDSHRALRGKTMIVMASNTGGDVGQGQLDLMIPGGGLGQYKEGCQRQWSVNVYDESVVGKHYGGFTTSCNESGQGATLESLKSCVRKMCNSLFSGKQDLLNGCLFYVDWMQAADNPTYQYKEVTCPAALQQRYK